MCWLKSRNLAYPFWCPLYVPWCLAHSRASVNTSWMNGCRFLSSFWQTELLKGSWYLHFHSASRSVHLFIQQIFDEWGLSWLTKPCAIWLLSISLTLFCVALTLIHSPVQAILGFSSVLCILKAPSHLRTFAASLVAVSTHCSSMTPSFLSFSSSLKVSSFRSPVLSVQAMIPPASLSYSSVPTWHSSLSDK